MRVDSDGVGIEVQQGGDPEGPVVLFLHGLSGSAEYYRWVSPAVVGDRRILRMDLRGHGRSDRTPGAYRVQRYADDAIAVLEAAGGDPAVLVGHSLGGSTAWTVAQRRPDLVAGVLLEDPPLYAGEQAEYPGSVAERAFPVLRDVVTGWQAERLDHATWVARVGAMPTGANPAWRLADELTEDALDARATSLSLVDPDAIDAATTTATLAGTDTVAPLAVPALLLRGDAGMGPAIEPRHAERLAAEHPEVEVVEVLGAGHYVSPARATQARFAELLTDFLGRR